MGLSQSLPVTSYIKMIDIWMLFTMTIPFLEVVLHTTNEVLKRRATHFGPDKRVDVIRVKSEDEEERKTINSMNSPLMSCLILPVSSVIFTVIFWVVGLFASHSAGDVQEQNMTDCLTIDLS